MRERLYLMEWFDTAHIPRRHFMHLVNEQIAAQWSSTPGVRLYPLDIELYRELTPATKEQKR